VGRKIKCQIVNGKKKCGGCGEWKLLTEFYKARNHYTGLCRTCNYESRKEYRERPEYKEQTKQYHKKYIKNPQNKKRVNDYNREYRKRDYVKERCNEGRRAWALKQKLLSIEYKGGCCVICGYSKCPAALDFHHLDPSEKEYTIKQHWVFENRKEELGKCILVCSNCHREIHAGDINDEKITSVSGL